LAEFKRYMSLLTKPKLPNIVIVMVANELKKENRIMNETAIVSHAPRTVHNRIRISTKAERGRLLEGLRAAYQRLGREAQQRIKNLMLTLSKSNGDSLWWKENTNRRGTYGDQPILERCSTER
jgi:hypothetical protein